MFLLRDGNELVFLHRNPRYQGFAGEVEGDVNFYYPEEVRDGANGAGGPRACVGMSNNDPKSYRVFGSDEECREAGYRKVAQGTPKVFERWSDYALSRIQHALMPEHAREYLAINLETGEYALGRTASEASAAFWARWPNKPMFGCRVDGGPSIRFRGSRRS